MSADPVVHGVAADELRVLHGVAHSGLQHRVDVGEKEEFRVVILGRNRGFESFENVQLGAESFSFVDVLAVLASPVKGLPFRVLDATRVDAALVHHGFVFRGEVLTHDGHHAHVGKIAGGEREVSSRAAQDFLALAVGSFQGIECN